MVSHHFKKYFGQNFLRSENISKRLAHSLKDEIDTVIEIGPGNGQVTKHLLDRYKNVYSVEIDAELYPVLEEKFKDNENFHLVKSDVLRLEISDQRLETSNSEDTGFKIQDSGDEQQEFGELGIENWKLKINDYSVVGSLPYNISKKIINKFLKLEHKPKEMVFLIQKEVAEDYAVKPPKATFLSNLVNAYGEIEYLETIKKEEFYPTPKVDGGVIRIFNINKNPDEKFIKFIKGCFASPRKTLLNNLSNLLRIDKEMILKAFGDISVTEKVRASEITIDDFEKLYNHFH